MTDPVNTDVQVEPTANETEARASGWVPKEEYNGDENKWVDADEFVRRGPLFKKIDGQQRELKEVRKALDQLKNHHNSVKENAYKDALASLKAEKRNAFTEGDPDKIIQIDERIDLVKEQQRQFSQERAQEVNNAVREEIHPDFAVWTERNPWYNTSRPMRAFADALGIELRATGLTPQEVLKKVELQVKEEFPTKFRNPNRDKASPVEGTSKGSGKPTNDGLSDMERNVMERFVRQNVMTREQYIAEIKKSRAN